MLSGAEPSSRAESGADQYHNRKVNAAEGTFAHAKLECLLCCNAYTATVSAHTPTLGADGVALCAACSNVVEQLLNRHSETPWTEEVLSEADAASGTEYAKFVRGARNARFGEGDILRIGECRSRNFQMEIPAPRWWWNRQLKQRLLRHFTTDRRGKIQGYEAGRVPLYAQFHWGCGLPASVIAEEFGVTPRAVENSLMKFRRRADRFLVARLVKGLQVRFPNKTAEVARCEKSEVEVLQ
jgi:hypothetical protein